MNEENGAETVLLSGQRVYKDDERVKVCGIVDEISCHIGVVKSFLERGDEVSEILTRIQGQLFALGSQISALGSETKTPTVTQEDLDFLDQVIQTYGKSLPKLTSFIYPGGSRAAAFLHLARAAARRGERAIVALSRRFPIDPKILAYVNKLSSALFVLARYVNFREGLGDETWNKILSGDDCGIYGGRPGWAKS
ncbi:MAG: cob(I)yrinic acid a,c-diamide adenosyltransferase [Nitrososphaerota archaeon]|nr:cob(I)yrinic acid a,c-diamide adenosyltransferase [Nitrososphaerota archaeon]